MSDFKVHHRILKVGNHLGFQVWQNKLLPPHAYFFQDVFLPFNFLFLWQPLRLTRGGGTWGGGSCRYGAHYTILMEQEKYWFAFMVSLRCVVKKINCMLRPDIGATSNKMNTDDRIISVTNLLVTVEKKETRKMETILKLKNTVANCRPEWKINHVWWEAGASIINSLNAPSSYFIKQTSTITQISLFPGQLHGSGIQMKITPPQNPRYKCIGWNTQTRLSGTNYCRAHIQLSGLLTPQKNDFPSFWQICARLGVGVKKTESEMVRREERRGEEGAGEAHTEKLLINRVTVMIPPDEENVNAHFSIRLATKRCGSQECPRSQIPSQQRPAGLLTSINPLDIL